MTTPPNRSPGTPTSLMRGKLCQTSQGALHVTDNISEIASEKWNDKMSTSKSHSIDFLKDDRREMTWGRRIALCLMDKKWYNPRAAEGEDTAVELVGSDIMSNSSTELDDDFDEKMSDPKPRLDKAWAYFEHVALYRYLVPPEDQDKEKKNIFVRMVRKFMKANKKFEKAEPGESEHITRMYHPVFTPHKQLGDFGLGIGLYFSTLRAITFFSLLAGLVSLYNILYFSSEAYLPLEYQEGIPTLLVRRFEFKFSYRRRTNSRTSNQSFHFQNFAARKCHLHADFLGSLPGLQLHWGTRTQCLWFFTSRPLWHC